MKILFVFSISNINFSSNYKKPLISLWYINSGISTISAVLKKHGYKTRLALLTSKSPLNFLDEIIDDFKPDIIAFSSISSEFNFIRNTGIRIKNKYPKIYRIIGGVHVTLSPDEAILDIFDALCIGEGEYSMLEFVQSIEKGDYPTGIQNLWIKTPDGKIEKNPCREFIQNLDELPNMDREMWLDWVKENNLKRGKQFIILGRGCPFECTYCSNHIFKKVAPGKYVRLRNHEYIIKEIKEIKILQPLLKEIYFEIETFGVNIQWSLTLCEELKKLNEYYNNEFCFGVNLRVTPAFIKDAELLFSKMKEAGFTYINIGLESGSPRIRENVLNRFYSNDDIINSVSLAVKYGLKVSLYVLIGLPYETLEDFNMTVDTVRKCRVKDCSLSIFFPYPGTNLYKLCEKEKLLPDTLIGTLERSIAIMGHPQFSRQKIQKAFIWFRFYIRDSFDSKFSLARLLVEKYAKVYKNNFAKILVHFLQDVFSQNRKVCPNANEKSIIFHFLYVASVGYFKKICKILLLR